MRLIQTDRFIVLDNDNDVKTFRKLSNMVLLSNVYGLSRIIVERSYSYEKSWSVLFHWYLIHLRSLSNDGVQAVQLILRNSFKLLKSMYSN